MATKTEAQWREQLGLAHTALDEVLLDLHRPDGERIADAWPQIGACSDTSVSAAPEQQLRAWLDLPQP